jgi:hypothetical protein
VPDGFFVKHNTTFLSPEQIAPMVLRGIKNNRLIVFDHSDQRQLFVETYQKFVMQAFDDAEAYEKSMGPDWQPKSAGHP